MLQKATLSIPSCHQLSLVPQPEAGAWCALPPSRPGCQVTGDCVAMHSCCKHTSAVQLTAWSCTAAASTWVQLNWLWPCTAAVSIRVQLFCHGQKTVSIQSSLTSGSYNLSAPSSMMVHEPWGEGAWQTHLRWSTAQRLTFYILTLWACWPLSTAHRLLWWGLIINQES